MMNSEAGLQTSPEDEGRYDTTPRFHGHGLPNRAPEETADERNHQHL